MSVIALAVDQHRRFPLVIATNRDAPYARPAAPLGWWSTDAGTPILGGRDLQAGGTWMGLSRDGRLAMVVPTRSAEPPADDAPSRGGIVPLWLQGELRHDQLWMRIALSGYEPFQTLLADLSEGRVFRGGSDHPAPSVVERGVWGLSNGAWDAPWPKVRRLKAQLAQALKLAPSAEGLAARLMSALSDTTRAADAELPRTGLAPDLECALSAIFVQSPDGRYGTRTSTVLVVERARARYLAHVYEREHDATGAAVAMRRVTLRHWPPPPDLSPGGPLPGVTEATLAPEAALAVRQPRPRRPSELARLAARSRSGSDSAMQSFA
jgi:uncharacterized protein with NRDE domain